MVKAQRVPQEIQAGAFFPQIDNPCLLAVNLQPHPGLDEFLDEVDQALALVACEHDEVVGIAHYSSIRPVAWSVRSAQRPIEPVEEGIGQQWRDYSPLRRSFARAVDHRSAVLVLIHNRSLQPQTDQLEDRTVCYPCA